MNKETTGWHKHHSEMGMNRLTYRDLYNKTFEALFAKTLAEAEMDNGEPFSKEQVAKFRADAWGLYQKETNGE